MPEETFEDQTYDIPESEVVCLCTFNWVRLNQILDDKLSGTEIVDGITLHSTSITPDDGRIYIQAVTAGRKDLTLGIHCVLSPGDDRHPITVQFAGFRVEKGGVLAKGAEWVMKNLMGNRFEQKLVEKFQGAVDTAIHETVAKYSDLTSEEGLHLNILSHYYVAEEVHWNASDCIIQVRLKGRIYLQL